MAYKAGCSRSIGRGDIPRTRVCLCATCPTARETQTPRHTNKSPSRKRCNGSRRKDPSMPTTPPHHATSPRMGSPPTPPHSPFRHRVGQSGPAPSASSPAKLSPIGSPSAAELEAQLLGGEEGDARPYAAPAGETWLQVQIKAVLYGLINMIVVTPVMIGFAAIIFRRESANAQTLQALSPYSP